MPAVLITPLFFVMGIGGVVHPDVLFGARPEVQVSDGIRKVSRMLVVLGLAIGACACYFLFFRH